MYDDAVWTDSENDDPDVERCTALAHVGTGTGVCDTPLTPQGDCPRENMHVQV